MPLHSHRQHSDSVRAFLVLGAIIFGLSLYANLSYVFRDNPKALAFFPPFIEGVNLNHNAHLGAEYFFIAQAIASGKGFSNPFQAETGSTAWMPPLYCYLLALLILIGGSKITVGAMVVLLKDMVLIGVGMILYRIASKTTHRLPPWLVIPVYILLLFAYFRWFFQITHDEWILLLLVSTLFMGAALIVNKPLSKQRAVLWGCLGGVAMLASPIVGCVWCTVTFFIAMKTKRYRRLLVSALLCTALCFPWILRNYLVFDKIIFIKSNFYFDLYTSNYETEDGLHKESVVLRQHPVWTAPKNMQAAYPAYGEAAFMDIYKHKFLNAVSENPGRYLANVKNRLIAALLRYPVYGKYEKPSLFKSIVHAIPFFGLVLMVLCRTVFSSSWRSVAALIYITYLTPYVFVGYYIRYSIPLTAILCLFVFWGVDACSVMMQERNNRKKVVSA